MKHEDALADDFVADDTERVDPIGYDFGLRRRSFVQMLGAGLLFAVSAGPALAQGRGGSRPQKIVARLHIGKDGRITVLTGKVEGGQGARTELSLAAAEELRVPVGRVELLMADTDLVPDDGITAGSRTTPATVPAVRRGAAAAREALRILASKRWSVAPEAVELRDGQALHPSSGRALTYGDLAGTEEGAAAFEQAIPPDVSLTPVKEWRVLGVSTPRINGRDIVTGRHRYPSDMVLPGMLYGKVLRPPSYGATLVSIDLAPAQAMKGVIAVRDGQFVGVAAPTSLLARQALEALAKTARWETAPHPSSSEVFDYLKQKAQGGVPANPFSEETAQAGQVLRQTYRVPYVQHAPLEPRAATAEWKDGRLTVWVGTQNPFGHRSELARAFHLPEDRVRVIVPDFGSGFGGKHTADAAIEVARLAQAARVPVALHWTRREEFTWAYFRPAAVIEIEASLDAQGTLTSWHFVNINSGGAALDTPYRTGKSQCRFVGSQSPLRQGSYRALASTANNFARECFMDELAAAAHADPLAFRLAHLDNARLRAVLETAAQRFGWAERVKVKRPNVGVGLACGTEKGSFVAACVEIELNAQNKTIAVRRVCEVFECGPVLNPDNLRAQVQGAIIMGLGPALREEMRFEKGEMLNASFRSYPVPRFLDVPELDIHFLSRPDLEPVGGGETPIIAIAPAITNALFHATGERVRSLPVRWPGTTREKG